MAFWGRPYPLPDHASRACRAALLMQKQLAELNANWSQEGRQTLAMGIGLNTGRMIVGNMGSNKRFNYTVMGDAVNLGSRLEGQTKEYRTHIIISQSTYEEVQDEFVCRELDLIQVKGNTTTGGYLRGACRSFRAPEISVTAGRLFSGTDGLPGRPLRGSFGGF